MFSQNPVPLNMRLGMQHRPVTVVTMDGIFTKDIWQPHRKGLNKLTSHNYKYLVDAEQIRSC